jgi:MFS family permease
MVAALLLPRLLDRVGDRIVMLPAAASMAIFMLGFAFLIATYSPPALFGPLLFTWTLLGIGYSAAQLPMGRLLRRSAHAEDRPPIYAAQFALSHACWLVTYPLAGWLGSAAGMTTTLITLGLIAAIGAVMATLLWPVPDLEVIPHEHANLPPNHPHLTGAGSSDRHAHAYVIDDLHARWPVPTR